MEILQKQNLHSLRVRRYYPPVVEDEPLARPSHYNNSDLLTRADAREKPSFRVKQFNWQFIVFWLSYVGLIVLFVYALI
jgi:hypothetical protein